MGDYLDNALGELACELVMRRMCRVQRVTTPAAGADWSINVPGGQIWEPISVIGRFTTTAVAGNRSVEIQFLDGTDTFGTAASPVLIAASASIRLGWMKGMGQTNAVAVSRSNTVSMPDVWVPAGGSIQSVTTSIDAGDTWQNVVLYVREWDETAIMQETPEVVERLSAYIGGRQ